MSETSLQFTGRVSLRDRIYEALRSSIVSGEIGAGLQMSEPQIADDFQVSRSPVREALGRLEQEGLVVRRPNGRLYVAGLDFEELEQLYVLRASMEGLATRLAAPWLTTLDLDVMAHAIEQMEARLGENDIASSLKCGAEFHNVILSRCRNRPLVELSSSVRLRIERFRAAIAAQRDAAVRVAEHRRIHEALYRRDAEAAERAMIAHVEQSAQALLDAARARHRA